eukprot:gene29724-35887_t
MSAPNQPPVNPGLSDEFIKIPFLCCAFRCNNFEQPQCIGCKGRTQCCCIEDESYVCKYVTNGADDSGKDLCCVLGAGDCSCYQFKPVFKLFRQIFCFEWVCGCPLDEPVLTDGDMMKFANNNDGFDFMDNTLIIEACLCTMRGLYCQFPGCCCSEAYKGMCFCMQCSFVRNKCMCGDDSRSNLDLCCILQRGNCFCYRDCLGCNVLQQCWCMAGACALPCNEDVPCACTLLPFCVTCVDWQCVGCECCRTIAQVKGMRDKNRGITPPPAGGAPPASNPAGQVVVVTMPAHQQPAPVQVVYSTPQPVVVQSVDKTN